MPAASQTSKRIDAEVSQAWPRRVMLSSAGMMRGIAMRKIMALLALVLLAAGDPAQAEIVKIAVPSCEKNEICFYWWPKLPELRGWHGDEALNLKLGSNGSNVLIPDGQTFSNAPAIIYARAIYAERYDWQNKTKSTLGSFIADDGESFQKGGAGIADAPMLKTGDGQELKVVTYTRPKNWECVAYGEEDGHYLMFVLSANSEAGYKAALPIFQDLIARYRR